MGENNSSQMNNDNIDAMKDPSEIIRNVFDKEAML